MSDSNKGSGVLDVCNPYNGELLKQVPLNSAQDVEQALARAHALFNDRASWLPAYQRVEILENTAQIMSERVEELTVLAASEGGKPFNDSKVEVLRAINCLKTVSYTHLTLPTICSV